MRDKYFFIYKYIKIIFFKKININTSKLSKNIKNFNFNKKTIYTPAL